MAPTARTWRAALAAAALLLPGCGETESAGPLDGTYIGRVGETLIAIVVATDDNLTTAYACDGRDGVAPTVAAWFTGGRAGESELKGMHGALTATFEGESATGELRLDGATPLRFSAALATDGALLWAHTETGDMLLGGWVFADDGTQRGAVIKRLTGDVSAFSLASKTTTAATFEGTELAIKPMVTPVAVE